MYFCNMALDYTGGIVLFSLTGQGLLMLLIKFRGQQGTPDQNIPVSLFYGNSDNSLRYL
jgi:hypothetical protein